MIGIIFTASFFLAMMVATAIYFYRQGKHRETKDDDKRKYLKEYMEEVVKDDNLNKE